MAGSWTDDEPGLREFRQALKCVFSRARGRILWVVGLSVLAACLVGWRGASPPRFTSTIVIDVKDSNPGSTADTPSALELVQHLHSVALSRTSLLRVMDEFDLYGQSRKTAPELAVDDMRDRTDIVVLHDSISGPDQETTRSTRITLGYTAEDPELALGVARALGDTIAKLETSERRATSEGAIATMAGPESELTEELDEAERTLGDLKQQLRDLTGAEQVSAALEVRHMTERVRGLERQLRAVRSERAWLRLRQEAEDKEAGLRFTLLDEGALAPPPRFSSRERRILLTVVSFFGLLPLLGMVVGVWDSRVRNIDELGRLGIKAVGHIPAFHRHNAGSLGARMSTDRSA